MLTVRAFRLEDINTVQQMYAECRGDYLPQPDAQKLWEAERNNLMFVIEQAEGERRGTVLGAAGLFELALCRTYDGRDIAVFELAGMVLHPTLRGLGLQKVMLAVRTVALARQEHTNALLLASVVDCNIRSRENVEEMGFLETETRPWMTSLNRTWTRPGDVVIDYIMPPESVRDHASLLLNVQSRGYIERFNRASRQQERLPLNLAIGWLGEEELSDIEMMERGVAPEWERSLPLTRLIGQPPDWHQLD